MGTCLETRIQTRSKWDSTSIDMRLRNKYTRIKVNFFECGEISTNSLKSLYVIDSKHSLFCTEIEQCISEVLLARGDYALIGELKTDCVKEGSQAPLRRASTQEYPS